jgi:rod shape determining protein RodA
MRGQKLQSLPDWTKRLLRMDFILLGLVGALLAISIIYIQGIGRNIGAGSLGTYGIKQAVWAFAGFGIACTIAVIDYKIWGRYWVQIYAFGILSLIAVLIFGITLNNATSWIKIGPITLQPSEIAKPCTIVALAWVASQTQRKMSDFWQIIPVIIIGVLPILLIGMQPDMGSGSTFIPTTAAVLFTAGIKKRVIFYPLTCVIIMSPLVYFMLAPHQKNRIDVFIHPISHPIALKRSASLIEEEKLHPKSLETMQKMRNPLQYTEALVNLLEIAKKNQLNPEVLPDLFGSTRPDLKLKYLLKKQSIILEEGVIPSTPHAFVTLRQFYLDAGWHAKQSLLSIGSGGFKGKGLGKSTQVKLGFLPQTVSTTDSIFAVIAEEGGFIMGTVIILLQVGVFLCCIRISSYASNTFGKCMALGIGALFLYHIYINVGMAMNVAPILGIPLPFLSYGGSSVVAAMVSIGILQSIYVHREESQSEQSLKGLN